MIRPGETLAIHPGALGDVLLAVPALRVLRAQCPGRHLVLAAQPRLGHLLVALGVVDRAIDFESLGLGALFTAEPQGAARSALEAAGRVVCWFGSRDPLFTRNLRALSPKAVVAAPAVRDIPVWQHLCRTVGSALDGATARIPVPESARAVGRTVLADAGWDGVTPFMIVHPGAGSAAKRWPTEGFAAVVGALRQVSPAGSTVAARAPAVVVHWGPADAIPAAALLAALGPGAIALMEPALPALAGALDAAALYVGNDSGVSHLAAAIGAPGVLLYTRPLLAWRPWAGEAQIVAVSTAELIEAEVRAVIDAARTSMA